VLFISPYPSEGPSYRYRVELYFAYLKRNGIEYLSRPFMSSGFYKIIYKPRHTLAKFAYFLSASLARCLDFFRSFRYDTIFIHLEAYPIGPPIFEYLLAKFGKTVIYDLDDAIFLTNRGSFYKIINLLKFNKKIETIIRLSREVIVCNDYLKEYAANFKDKERIHVIPTSLDTDKFIPDRTKKRCADSAGLVIGWIGSHSTAPYLKMLENVFKSLGAKYDFTLKIVGSNFLFKIEGVKVINEEWSFSRDLADFQSLDIGVYPLPDNEWTKGKTGFKTIQYMAVGTPCVVSNVGRNREIIQDGINGFLADSEEEWIENLSFLIENPELREKMGARGRKTVEENYSVKVNAVKFLEVIENIYAESR
jgi:glycosyltransferase involved in cell wall biosynthesis